LLSATEYTKRHEKVVQWMHDSSKIHRTTLQHEHAVLVETDTLVGEEIVRKHDATLANMEG